MSPTLDENATVRDARLMEHGKRALFLRGLSLCTRVEGLPAPCEVDFNDTWADLRMDEGATDDVDDWAAFLGVEAGPSPRVHREGTPQAWRAYETRSRSAEWRGYEVSVWCVVLVGPVAP